MKIAVKLGTASEVYYECENVSVSGETVTCKDSEGRTTAQFFHVVYWKTLKENDGEDL